MILVMQHGTQRSRWEQQMKSVLPEQKERTLQD